MTVRLAGLLAAALLAGCASPSPASTEAAQAPNEPRQCFFSSNINGFSSPDDRTVYLKVGVGDVYRLDLFSRCPDVDWGWKIGVQTRGGGSSICTGLDVDLLVPSPIGPQKCPVRSLHKLTPEEIAALPRGAKP